MNKNVYHISEELGELMENYNWPGNVRQLEHFIENIMIRTEEDDNYLRIENIPEHILENMMEDLDYDELGNNQNLQEKLDNMEEKLILESLKLHKWNVTKTAEALGITRQSLNYRMRKFNIKRD